MPRKSRDASRTANLRARAVRQLRVAGSVSPPPLHITDVDELSQEVRIHQVELEMQYDELSRQHLEAERGRIKYQSLYDRAPAGYFSLDEEGIVREVNEAGEALLDEPRRLILNRRFLVFVASSARVACLEFCTRVLETKGPESIELLLEKKDRSVVTVLVSAIAGRFDRKSQREIRLAVFDIGAQRREPEALAAKVEAMRERDRTRIARQIHDELGETLTNFRMDLSWLQAQQHQLSYQRLPVVEKLGSMLNLIDATMAKVKNIAKELRPILLDQLGLLPALEYLANDYETRTGIRCTFSQAIGQGEFNRTLSTSLFRIVQEALTNIARHAHASLVQITIREQGGHLLLEIVDNGRGITQIEASSPESLGILSMKERAALLGGEATIEGRSGEGTRVAVLIPSNPLSA